ncbi:carboxypeptidase M32 [Desulfovibrio ferrophilus]|uniref:Metal-dependent carboxypeptidase n=1 Tax=Desulfovibrio ferrophilus TaxID=241368 RepID=A0A2Z6AZI1_9BACT|nr:carboxypeptidase M32 [Desulfovibrio ferrophilus]BBD08677.1 carboxypeptidase Taq [Desulfovibrio ferrophilus]
MPPKEAYDWLKAHHVETSVLESMGALLHWDQSTMMPGAGHGHRSEQFAALAKLTHERRSDPRIGDALAACGGYWDERDPIGVEAANVREWMRAFERATKIPSDLAVALARAASDGETAWKRARPDNDWKAFQPYLDELIRLRREEAEAVGYQGEPYDALLDEYEHGETAATLEPMFRELRHEIVNLLDSIKGSSRAPDPSILNNDYPTSAQKQFCRQVAQAVGYDLKAGRLDATAHPFSTRIGPGDVRITTRYNEHNLSEALFGTIHEAGHAMYSQGLPAEHFGTPSGVSVSLGIHESQSRLWENLVGHSAGFWRHFFPQARDFFPCLKDVSESAFLFAVNEVQPTLIRVEADEVTYNLHVMLRFELELALLRGDLSTTDLPAAWDEKMRDFLGITPPDFAQGVMQDVHWSAGLIGYFPTYSLGNLYAAQLFEAASKALGDIESQFERGNFSPLLSWLRENVHIWGSRMAPRELVRKATGYEPDSGALIRGLKSKYAQLYGI